MEEGKTNKRAFKRRKDMETDDTNTLVGSSSNRLSNQSSLDTVPSSYPTVPTTQHDDDFNKTSRANKNKYFKKSYSADPTKRQITDDFRNDVITSRGQPVQSKSLSMVVTINKSDDEQKKKNGGKMLSFLSLLSSMYAITVSIVGLLMPLAGSIKPHLKKTTLPTQVINDSRSKQTFYQLFEVYIYTVSIAILIYFQVVMIDLKCRPCKKNKQKDEEDAENIINNNNNNIDIIDHLTNNTNDDDDDFKNTKPAFDKTNSLETSKLFHSSYSVGDHKEKEFSGVGEARGHKLSEVVPPVAALIRFNSSTQIATQSISSFNKSQGRGLTPEETRMNQDSNLTRKTDLLDEIPRVDEVRCLDEEVVEEVYIDLSQLGNVFSHHGSSFFLRIGTLLFGIGHMIFIMLELENSANDKLDCLISSVWYAYVLRFIFVFVQTFVIFKHPGITPNRGNEAILRCGFMHVIATNMCLWVKTLMSEISYESNTFADKHDNNDAKCDATDGHAPNYYNNTDEAQNCTQSILHKLAPILFPFIMEYCLLCISVVAVMFWTLRENRKDDIQKGLTNLFKIDVFVMDKDKGKDTISEKGEQEHGDGMFGKSHRGIFLGFVLIAGVLIVVAFVNFGQTDLVRCTGVDEDKLICKEFIYLGSCLGMIFILLIGVIAGIITTNPLSFIKRPCSIDDALLIIAMFGGVMYHMVLIMASVYALLEDCYKDAGLEALRITNSAVTLLFLYCQVILVTSGLRRYPSRHSQVEKKPGRSYITFLVVANIGSWIFHSMLASNHDFHYRPKALFGKTAGIILSTISLPLLIFFFFHSSVCLADVWHQAYTPLQNKLRKPIHPDANTTDGNRLEKSDNKSRPLAYTSSQQCLTDGIKTKSALSLLNPLIRSISVSQLSQTQIPTQTGNFRQLERNAFAGSLSQLQENQQPNQKPYFSRVNRLSPLASQTEFRSSNNDDDRSNSNATIITVTDVNGDDNNNDKYNDGFDADDNDNVYSVHM